MNGYREALGHLLGIEGGLADDPDDRGGRTNHGVTQATYDRYRKAKGEPIRFVDYITKDEVVELYETMYWRPSKAHLLPWPVSHVHFDAYVHHNPRLANRILQRAADVEDDGIIGPVTIQAVKDAVAIDDHDGVNDFIGRVLWHRFDALLDIVNRAPSQRKFFRGWMNRIATLRSLHMP
jgi:lysozyme family protein